MKNKILYVLVLILVGLCTYWAGYKIGGDKAYTEAFMDYASLREVHNDPARLAAEECAREYELSECVDITSTPTPPTISTPTPKPKDPVDDAKASRSDTTIVYVYLDEDSKVVSIEAREEPKDIAPGDSYDEAKPELRDEEAQI